jgi:glycosyltransferase involved in cell wall biosynthesis
MKKVLLLSYYYPPYTGIEGNRINSWANTLASNGFKVTVITRHWKPGAQDDWKDYYREYDEKDISTETINENLSVIRVPYKWSRFFKMIFPTKLSSVFYWSNSFWGHFHIETNAYRALKNTAKSAMAREKFNFIIVSSPPVNIIRLGKYLKKKFGVPFIADFRDSYDNQLLNPNYIPPVKKKIEFFLFRKSLKRWLAQADIICSVSDAVLQTLPIYSSRKKIIVMNGYEEDNRQLKDRQKNENMFIISIVGSLYPQQDIDFMVKGLYHFIKKINPDKLLIRFVGLKSRLAIRSKIEKEIDAKYLQFTNRVSRDEALQLMHSSSILLQVGWRGYKGFCPGKVFEYLATGKNILVAPGDGDLTDKIIAETNAGRSVTTIEEMADYLSEQYQEWLRCGRLSYHGIPGKLEKYSRKNQNMILVDALDNYPDSMSAAS